MAAKQLPEVGYVRECLDYDPLTGIFLWKIRPREHFASDRGHWQWNPKFAGKAAGWPSPHRYHWIAINLVLYRAHRLAWLLVHGEPVPDEIDHIDCDKLNNRIANLRPATRLQNSANVSRRKDNTTGVKGVTFDKQHGRFRAYVGHRRIGLFHTLEQAAAARREAAERLHGKFARHE